MDIFWKHNLAIDSSSWLKMSFIHSLVNARINHAPAVTIIKKSRITHQLVASLSFSPSGQPNQYIRNKIYEIMDHKWIRAQWHFMATKSMVGIDSGQYPSERCQSTSQPSQ